MSDSGNVNVGDDAKVYGTVVGQNTGTINTTVNIGGFCRSPQKGALYAIG